MTSEPDTEPIAAPDADPAADSEPADAPPPAARVDDPMTVFELLGGIGLVVAVLFVAILGGGLVASAWGSIVRALASLAADLGLTDLGALSATFWVTTIGMAALVFAFSVWVTRRQRPSVALGLTIGALVIPYYFAMGWDLPSVLPTPIGTEIVAYQRGNAIVFLACWSIAIAAGLLVGGRVWHQPRSRRTGDGDAIDASRHEHDDSYL
jgi:hypothetical protein